MISVISPVYMGKPFVRELYIRVAAAVNETGAEFELILVNDASPDGAWDEIQRLCKEDDRVKGINLSRNFGQHYAIMAGLEYAAGEWIVVMDCDLQDRPEEITGLYRKAQEGYESVFAQRVRRQDTMWKRMQSKIFHFVFSFLTDTRIDPAVANFGIYHRKVIDATLSMGDKLRFFPTMVQWVGFRKAYYPVKHDERKQGKTSYSTYALIRLALDTILSFSDKPLRICVFAGAFLTGVAFLVAMTYFTLAVFDYFVISGFASIMISLWFVAGILMTMLGITGIYVGKVFNQVKGRPLYIVAERLNFDACN